MTNVQPGDFVIVPFTHGCGECQDCLAGFDGDCLNNRAGGAGYQAEYLRYVGANWGLVKIPGQPSDYSDEMLNSFVTLADVMATGFHAAFSAEVKKGDTVAVVGDGAVGLAGIISAKLSGAQSIIAMSRHEDRQKLALEFGATAIVAARGTYAVAEVMALTEAGVNAVLEAEGSQEALETAVKISRPGAVVGRVWVPHLHDFDTNQLFWRNIGLRGVIAAVTTHVNTTLLQAVLDGTINPGKVFNQQFKLDDIRSAYEAIDQRTAIKSLHFSDVTQLSGDVNDIDPLIAAMKNQDVIYMNFDNKAVTNIVVEAMQKTGTKRIFQAGVLGVYGEVSEPFATWNSQILGRSIASGRGNEVLEASDLCRESERRTLYWSANIATGYCTVCD